MEKGQRTNQRVQHFEFQSGISEAFLAKHQILNSVLPSMKILNSVCKREGLQLSFAKHQYPWRRWTVRMEDYSGVDQSGNSVNRCKDDDDQCNVHR